MSGFESVKCYTNTRWYFYESHLLFESTGREKAEPWFVCLFSWARLKREFMWLLTGLTLHRRCAPKKRAFVIEFLSVSGERVLRKGPEWGER